MTNFIKVKNLKCIEWVVQTSGSGTYISETFSFQDMKCFLQFSLDGRSTYWSYLYFKRNRELQSALEITVRSSIPDKKFDVVQSFTSTNQSIWSSHSVPACSLFTFEVIVHTDNRTDDKSVQLPSYKDACFSVDSLLQDFSRLLDEGPYHDVEFTCGDQTIKAHKSILCCRSIVFASMLQSDMVEGKTGQVTIKEIDAAIFRQFLRCLYTGMLPELTVDSAFQFYEVSDRYGVDAIKKQCTDFLTDNLSIQNACDILALSDQHSDAGFKKTVMKYVIKENIPFIGQKWMDFCKDYPILALEVYSKFCEQFRPK